jgi:hypothetical protein
MKTTLITAALASALTITGAYAQEIPGSITSSAFNSNS